MGLSTDFGSGEEKVLASWVADNYGKVRDLTDDFEGENVCCIDGIRIKKAD